jgi:hypothetical protein
VDDDLWTIPGERYTNKLDHVIPLTAQARALIGDKPKGCDGNSWFVFTTTSGAKGFGGFSKAKRGLDAAIAELRARDHREAMPAWTLHDLRRTARSLGPRCRPTTPSAPWVTSLAACARHMSALEIDRCGRCGLTIREHRLVDEPGNPPEFECIEAGPEEAIESERAAPIVPSRAPTEALESWNRVLEKVGPRFTFEPREISSLGRPLLWWLHDNAATGSGSGEAR